MADAPKGAAQWNKMVGVRLEAKTRYLAELAADVKGFSTLTDYIKWALEESFKLVTLRAPDDREPFIEDASGKWVLPKPRSAEEERSLYEEMSIGNMADILWSESAFIRMVMLSMIAPYRLSEDGKALLSYIRDRKDLWIPSNGGRIPNREKIDSEWELITAAFEKSKKGKVK
jgi:hypothetical protein